MSQVEFRIITAAWSWMNQNEQHLVRNDDGNITFQPGAQSNLPVDQQFSYQELQAFQNYWDLQREERHRSGGALTQAENDIRRGVNYLSNTDAGARVGVAGRIFNQADYLHILNNETYFD
ncbi:MAG: hypothetical protein SFZ03_08655 [Candidatus Melainabacteria bacterium]|nr:hypothetical protein [Candidatus Melainabacteria bacterium]